MKDKTERMNIYEIRISWVCPMWAKAPCSTPLPMPAREAANYPFCTIDPNVGVVAVPDERLDELAEMYEPKKLTPAVIEFVDIAGLVKGAVQGRGSGQQVPRPTSAAVRRHCPCGALL